MCIETILTHLRQTHLARGVEGCNAQQKAAFLKQLKALSLDLLQQQRKLLTKKTASFPFEPLTSYRQRGREEEKCCGKELLKSGKVGCLILAGGVGSRLGLKGPKGMLSITPFKKKTLFQIVFEKAAAAMQQTKAALPVALMTSPPIHQESERYLRENNWFGVEEKLVSIFSQAMLPYLDEEGNWVLEEPGKVAMGPSGNGEALAHFFHTGIWRAWKERGVELVHIILIDNPLADPFDSNLCGYHRLSGSEVTVKAFLRYNKEEKVGVLVESKGSVRIVEYTELPEKKRNALNSSGAFVYPFANTGLFCMSMDFIERCSSAVLPLHFAKKQADILNEEGVSLHSPIWKFETFIFDLLAYSKHTGILVYPREEIFAPLKQLEGEGDIASVQRALLQADRRIYSEVTGCHPPDFPFELDLKYHYPTQELLNTWHGKPLLDIER